MKRYQCIKNVLSHRSRIIFKAGSVYDQYDLDLLVIDRSMIKTHFQELLDLNIPDEQYANPMEENEYVALQPVHGCLRFIAFGIAISATLGIFIYLALRWRS